MSQQEILSYISSRCEVAEGPFWWDNALWFIDINPGLLHRWDHAEGVIATWHLGERTGTIVPVAGTEQAWTFIAAQQSGIYRIRLAEDRVIERICLHAPESHLPNNRFNDGKCDSKGRLWAGTMSMMREAEQGALYCFDPGVDQVSKKLDRVSLSNGLDWSPDGKTFYFIDTPTRKIDAFDFDLVTGEISRRRTLLNCPEAWGMPDGMTVDAEGMLWVAFWDGGAVRRIDPATGGMIDAITLPCSRITSCCFGGDALDVLFITTARGTDNVCDNQPLAGNVFMTRPGVRGKTMYGLSTLIPNPEKP